MSNRPNLEEVRIIARAAAASQYYPSVDTESKATMKILTGLELGIGPCAALTEIHIVNGRPSLSANLIAGLISMSPGYSFELVTLTEQKCEIKFNSTTGTLKELGRSVFTMEDARRAGTKNLDKYPRNMLFARALTNGARWYTPDIFAGVAVYTPEELGADDLQTIDAIQEAANTAIAPAKVEKSIPAPVEPKKAAALDVEIAEETGPQTAPEPAPAPIEDTHAPTRQKKLEILDGLPADTTPEEKLEILRHAHTHASPPKFDVDLGLSLPALLVACKLADTIPAAAGMLNKSPFITGTPDRKTVLQWALVYRSARGEGASSDDAAKIATTAYELGQLPDITF